MKIRTLFYMVMILIVVLLSQSLDSPAISVQAQGPISFIEHTIADYFDGANFVFA